MSHSILLVDDEHLVIKGLRIMLVRSGLPLGEIREAENGRQAWAMVKERAPDLLVTDIRMPEMDGLELCRTLRAAGVQAKIVILSGYGDFKYAQEAMKYGARDYLLKPVQRAELIQTISRLLAEESGAEGAHIAYKELESIIRGLEEGLWHGADDEIRRCVQRTRELLAGASLQYCLKIAGDVGETLCTRLSSRLGQPLEFALPRYAGNGKEGFFPWFEELLREWRRRLEERRESADYGLFETAREYIRENYASDITLEELARKIGFSPSYFSQMFKLRTGKSFVQFKNEIRLAKALELLEQPGKTATEVALAVGYHDLTYFIRAFKEFTGLTPNEFKRKRK